jgi:hypothetical protein
MWKVPPAGPRSSDANLAQELAKHGYAPVNEPSAGSGANGSSAEHLSLTPPSNPDDTTAELGGGILVTKFIDLTVTSPSSSSGGSATSSLPPQPLPDDLTLTVVKSPLSDSTQSAQIPPDAYAAAIVRQGGHALQLVVRLFRDHLGPGSYSGTVMLEDQNKTVVATIPLTMKVRYQHIVWLAVLFAPLILIGGGAFVYSSGKGLGTDAPLLSTQGVVEVLRWMRRTVIPVALGISAAVVAFVANTLSNPTFGSNAPKSYLSLLGVTFAAFTTALAAGSAKGEKGA